LKNPDTASSQTRFLRPGASIQVQSVLYGEASATFAGVERAVLSLGRAAELAIAAGIAGRVELSYGDSSSSRCLTAPQLEQLRGLYPETLRIQYDFFDGNLGSAAGHNRLAQAAMTDFILVQNPDVVVSPRLLINLLSVFRLPGIGMAEAKQLPIEHPKDYDPQTGETSWATTACALIPLDLFRALGGFDSETFFLYSDDVDFSWAVRLAGYKVIFQPGAVVFHDKRLSDEGKWQPSGAERYYSAEAALLLAHKWSRPEIVGRILAEFEAYGDPVTSRAKASFETRARNGTLPTPRDPDHRIGQFIDGTYAQHRYAL
jgi:GT2 family glycosyltransferase